MRVNEDPSGTTLNHRLFRLLVIALEPGSLGSRPAQDKVKLLCLLFFFPNTVLSLTCVCKEESNYI